MVLLLWEPEFGFKCAGTFWSLANVNGFFLLPPKTVLCKNLVPAPPAPLPVVWLRVRSLKLIRNVKETAIPGGSSCFPCANTLQWSPWVVKLSDKESKSKSFFYWGQPFAFWQVGRNGLNSRQGQEPWIEMEGICRNGITGYLYSTQMQGKNVLEDGIKRTCAWGGRLRGRPWPRSPNQGLACHQVTHFCIS